MLQKIKKYIRHIIRRSSLSGLVGLVVVSVVIAIVIGSIQAIQQNFQNQLKQDDLQQKVAVLELEVQNQQLQNQYYTTDEFAELQARRLLGKSAAGEHVINLPPSTITAPQEASPQTTTSGVTTTQLKDRSHLEQWLYFLFSNKRST